MQNRGTGFDSSHLQKFPFYRTCYIFLLQKLAMARPPPRRVCHACEYSCVDHRYSARCIDKGLTFCFQGRDFTPVFSYKETRLDVYRVLTLQEMHIHNVSSYSFMCCESSFRVNPVISDQANILHPAELFQKWHSNTFDFGLEVRARILYDSTHWAAAKSN